MADPVFNTATATASVCIFSESDTRLQVNENGTWTFPESTGAYGTAELDAVDVAAAGKFVVAFLLDGVDQPVAQSRIGVYGDPSNPLPASAGGNAASEFVFNAATGVLRNNSVNTTYGSAIADGAILVMAWHSDGTTLKVWFGSESAGTVTWFSSGDPAAGTGEAWALTIADYTAWSLVVNDGSLSRSADAKVLDVATAGLTLPSGFTYLGDSVPDEAVIVKSLSTTEYIPAHFSFHAWDSTVASGYLHEHGFKWTVSGGSENDGVYTGPNLGLVWETAGTFTVRLDILDADGVSLSNTSTTVTVATPTYDTTIYVSAAGSDSNDGLSTGSPKLTFDAAVTAALAAHSAAEHTRISLRKGDSFTCGSTVSGPAATTGTFYIDSYGTGENPTISASLATAIIDQTNNASQHITWKISDVDFDQAGSGTILELSHHDTNGDDRGYDCCVSRCHLLMSGTGFACVYIDVVSGSETVTAYGDWQGLTRVGNVAFRDVDIESYSQYGVYGPANWFTFQRGSIKKPVGTGTEHGARFPYIRNGSFRGVAMENTHDTTTILRFATTRFTLDEAPARIASHQNTVEGCTFSVGGYLGVELNYASSDADNLLTPVGRIWFGNNSFVPHPDEPYPLGKWRCVTAYGDQVAIVGNTFYGICHGISSSVGSTVVGSADYRILIASNSHYAGSSSNIRFLGTDETFTISVNLRDNACYASLSDYRFIEGQSLAGELELITSDNNVVSQGSWAVDVGSAGSLTLAAWRTASSQDANSTAADPSFADPANDDWSIGVDSPCYDAGENIGASWLTREGTERSGTWDIGAFELGGSSITITPEPATATGSTAGPFVSTGGSGSGGTRSRRRRATIAATAHRY